MNSPLVKHVVLAAFTVLTWLFWLGPWNYKGGEYATGWIVGCALTLVIVLVCAVLSQMDGVQAAITMAVVFTITWIVWALTNEGSGRFLLWAVAILVGMGVAGVLLSFLIDRSIAAASESERTNQSATPADWR